MKQIILSLAASLMAATLPAHAAVPTLYGNVADEASIIAIPTDGSRQLTQIFDDDEYLIGNGGGVYADGRYYVVYLDDFNPYITYGCLTSYSFDGTTAQRISSKMLYDDDMFTATDMTYSPIDGKIYGVFTYYEDSRRVFGTLDPTTGRITRISDTAPWIALAADATGNLYGVDRQGNFASVSRTDGSSTIIGNTSLTPATPCSATIDFATGRCFLSMSDGTTDAALYEINLTTGQASTVMIYPGNQSVTGLFSLSQTVSAAPAPVENLSLNFEIGSLSGKVCFDTPSTLADGSPAQGNLTYTVTAGGNIIAMGQAPCGHHMEAAVVLPQAGEYTFSVTVANPDGMSEAATITAWIGEDNRATLTPEFTQTFSSADDLIPFTIIDANNDMKTWNYYNGRVRVSYNSYKAMDDWLISPRIALQGGMQYILTLNASTSTSCAERFEVLLGDAPAVEGMTLTVIEPTVLQSEAYNTPTEYKARFTVPADGMYYLGIHGISDEDMDTFYLHSFGISAPVALDTPAAPGLSLLAAPDFGLSVEVSLTAPTTGINGTPLDALEKMELRRDGILIATIDTPTPGAVTTITDSNGLTNGNHTYTAVAYAYGSGGDTAEQQIYVGTAVMNAPQEADFRQDSYGHVTIDWSAPLTDVLGREVRQGLYTYTIYAMVDNKQTTIATDLTDTHYEYTVCDEEAAQNLYFYLITAVTDAGESEPVMTDHKPVGAPDAIPYFESFAGGDLTHLFGIKRLAGTTAKWGIMTTQAEAADKDGGFVAMTGSYPGEKSRLSTGNIDFSHAIQPHLSFYYYSFGPDCGNTLDVFVDYGDGYTLLESYVTGGNEEGWHPVEINSLTPGVARLAFEGSIVSHDTVAIDAIRLEDAWDSVSLTELDAFMTIDGRRLTATTAVPTTLSIYTLDGRIVCSRTVYDSCTLCLEPGVYVVRFGTETEKIIVR